MTVVAMGCLLAAALAVPQVGRWAIIEGPSPDGGLYMVSGDARPEGADAWFDPHGDVLTRFDGMVRRDYLSSTYGISYRPINTNLVFKTPPVGWMTWYAVKFMASDSVVLHNARDFMAKFRGYTDEKPVLWVDWEWFHARFKEDGGASDTDMLSPRKDVYPRGLKPVADDLKALGFTPALWVSVFSDVRTNALWKAHPEWVLGEDMTWCGGVCGNPCAPGFCESFVPEIFKLYDSWGYEAYKWDTFTSASKRFARFHKEGRPVAAPRETFRRCAAAVRRAVGDDCYVMSCSGEFDDVNLMAIDIVDGGRIGGDIFSWGDFRKWGVDRILAYQPFHNTVFWADADNLVLRAEFSTEAQARTRVSIYALAGVPITLGDEIAALDDKRVDMIRRAMPVVMLRPASLRRGAPAPDLLPLRADFARPFGSWQVRGWSNLTTNRTLTASFAVSDAAVWDYWNDRLVQAESGKRTLTVSVAPGDTALYRVTPLEKDAPTLVSVSRHITQGGYELKDYAADETGSRGVIRCPGGETVKVTFLLPEGTEVASASHACDGDGRLVRLRLDSEGRRDVPFNLVLKRLPPQKPAAGARAPVRIALTFDDGCKDHLLIAAPMLEERGWRGVFNIVTDWVGSGPNKMTWDDIRELGRRGHEIVTHTKTHGNMIKTLESKGEAALRRELEESAERIRAETGARPRFACPPFIQQNEETARVCRELGLRQFSAPRHNFGSNNCDRVASTVDWLVRSGQVRADILHHGVSMADHGGWCAFVDRASFRRHLDAIAELERQGKIVVTDYEGMVSDCPLDGKAWPHHGVLTAGTPAPKAERPVR